MASSSGPTIGEIKVYTVCVPMTPHQTASGPVSESPLVLIDVILDNGITGHGILFTYTRIALRPVAELVMNMESLIKGETLAPADISQKLSKRFRLLGTQGLVGMAIAGIDMALWDALARTHHTSLVRLLGGVERPQRAYGAVGYDGAAGAARTAEGWATRGFTGVKAKIGYPDVQDDLAVV